jgi:hypothetical protein
LGSGSNSLSRHEASLRLHHSDSITSPFAAAQSSVIAVGQAPSGVGAFSGVPPRSADTVARTAIQPSNSSGISSSVGWIIAAALAGVLAIVAWAFTRRRVDRETTPDCELAILGC